MLLTTLLIVTLGAVCVAGSDNITVQLVPNTNNVTEGQNFTFKCTSSVNVSYLSILVDRKSEGSKFDRITAMPGSDEVTYVFNNTMYTDDNTIFMCQATNGSMVYNSTEFVLPVFFSPKLVQGNNITSLKEIQEGTTVTLPVILLAANPPVENITNSTDSTNTTGVTFSNNTMSGNITFDPSHSYNRGNYTVTFTNAIGSTQFTYRTYVGGEPEDCNVDCDYFTDSHNAIITCTITDDSSAPATSINITVGALVNLNMTFERIPASEPSLQILDKNLNELSADNYTIAVVAINQLGSATVYNESIFIDGRYTETVIKTMNDSVIEGQNLTFTCSTPTSFYTNFSVIVNNVTNERVIPMGPAVNGSQTFILTNASWTDNGGELRCISNNTWRSVELPMDVLYHPRYFGTVASYLVNGTVMDSIILNVSSNPAPSSSQWTHNGSPLRNGVTGDSSSLNFSMVQLSDVGTYELVAGNEAGNGTFKFDLDIYYVPYFNQDPVLVTITEGHKFELSVNVSADPAVTSSIWYRNGTKVEPSERIVLGLTNITVNNVLRMDGTGWAVNVSNEAGSAMYNFSLDVLYAPIITSETQSGYMNSSFTLTVHIDSNPPSTSVWMKDGNILKSGDGLTVTNDSVTFNSLALSDNGTYYINTTNKVGNDSAMVELAIIYGPIFAHLPNNGTMWVEYATGTEVTLSCDVIASYPPVTNLSIVSPAHTNDSNWKPVKNGDNSIAVHIPKASQENTVNYMCMGENGKTSTSVTFQTFIGGAPDKTKVDVTLKRDNDMVSFDISVTDSSEAPPRQIIYTNPTDPSHNRSFDIPYPLINGKKYDKPDFYSASYGDLTSGQMYMMVYASNNVSTALIQKVQFSIPPKPVAKKSHTGAIVAGVLVPILVILIIVGVVFGVLYYMRRRKMTGFSPLKAMADPDVTATTYGTTNS